MLDFEIQKFTRRCTRSQRELAPGESYYSVLVPQGGDVVRLDYARDSWDGPPENAIGWWRSEVPDPHASRLHWAPHEVMLDCFERLHETSSKREFCYLLALLMIRRRIFKLESCEKDAQGGETLLVYCSRNDREYRILVATPDAARAAEIQQDLAELLFAKAR